MNELMKIDYKDFGLKEEDGKTIEQAFTPKIIERDALAKIYEQLIKKELTIELSLEAGELRRKLVKVRTGIADIHKTQKAFSLAYGKLCDAWKNKETLPNVQMEEVLFEMEKFAEIEEKKRLDKLQSERVEKISMYLEDANERDLSGMQLDVWEAYFNTKKSEYEQKKESERKAEELRIAAEKAEQARIKKIEEDNRKLAIEAEKARIEKQKLIDEQEKKDAERIKKEQAAEKERQRLAAIEAEKLRIAKELQDKKLADERAKKEEIEAILKANEEAKTQRSAEHEAELKAIALAPDKDKLQKLANDLLSFDLPDLKSDEAKNVLIDVKSLLNKISNHIESKIETLK